MKHGLVLIAVVAALAACTEKPQTIGSNATLDAGAYQGTGLPSSGPGWKPGDKGGWEQQLQARSQNQNDYTRVN